MGAPRLLRMGRVLPCWHTSLGMRLPFRRQTLVATCALVVAACGAATGTEPAATIVGTYALKSFGGALLPLPPQRLTDGSTSTFLSGSLVFGADGTFARTTLFSSERNGVITASPTVQTGTYTVRGDSIAYQLASFVAPAGNTIHPISSGKWSGASVTFLSGVEEVYVRADTATPRAATPIVTSVSVSPGAARLNVGDTTRFTAAVVSSGNANTGVVWSSSNPAVATVASTGLATSVGVGTVTITATSVQDSTRSGSATLAVTQNVASLTITALTTSMQVNSVKKLEVIARDSIGRTAALPALTWSSSNPAVASISGTGVLTGMSFGTAAITVTNGVVSTTLYVAVLLASPLTASVVGGDVYSCSLALSGKASCWGQGAYGSMGDGTTSNQHGWGPVVGSQSFVSITSGTTHACGLAMGGEAYCWGFNRYGQVGDSTTIDRTFPVRVASPVSFTMITAGSLHTCGLAPDGTAYCWGDRASGDLGDGAPIGQGTAAEVRVRAVAGGLSFVRLSAGGTHTCGLTASGDAYCWGDNVSGQLGDLNANVPQNTPKRVVGGLKFKEISAGFLFTCALTATGTAYCWGENELGQLGIGSTLAAASEPTAVRGGLTFSSLMLGSAFASNAACAVRPNGAAYCWGENSAGQLGDASTTNRLAPVAVATSLTFVSVVLSTAHTCGVTVNGDVYCWGDNSYGQLGDGTRASRSIPVRVNGAP